MALELQQLRQVVALAEHRSFVRASAALHISQPALSRSIQNLERRFGNSLFLRSTAGVVPTDLGRLYIERARDLLRMADELESEAIGHAAQRTGRVSIGGGPYPTDSFLGPATARFVEQFPRVSVQLLSGDWDDLVHRLRSRTLDFFVADASLLTHEPDLEMAPMPGQHPVYFCARAEHPLAQGPAAVRAADVMAWPFATPARIPPRILDPMLLAHREVSSRLPVARPFPAISCNGLAPVKRLVAASNVVTASILPCIADELDGGRFVLLATEPWMHLRYGLVSLRGRPWTQTAETLRKLVFDAERDATQLERRLLRIHAPRRRARSARAKSAVRSRNVAGEVRTGRD
ncbi:MAG: LysR family transcriptional regulator [Steroidobacteraceae bacterium]|nr:LysR family transcriptional regulator [Steroidobacteraceae bacterium]